VGDIFPLLSGFKRLCYSLCVCVFLGLITRCEFTSHDVKRWGPHYPGTLIWCIVD
jgi:hypothetical protein